MNDHKKPVLEPKTRAFIDAINSQGGTPLYEFTYEEARKVLEDAQSIEVTKLPADVEDRALPAGPAGAVSVRIYRPQGSGGLLPVVMYFHGGGWILGSKNTHDRLLRDLVNGTDAAFVFVNYTPSPEAQFPVPIEEAYAATQYVAEHGQELGFDTTRLAVAGDSAGGNMTAAVTLLAKERKGPAIRYQVLFYPVTDGSLSQDTYKEFAGGLWLTTATMGWMWDAYAPNKEDRKKVTASPLRATVNELEGLPPALIVVGENDILRDEGEAYARKLMQAGVEVTAVRVLATLHDFAMLNSLADTPAAKLAVQLASQKLAAALSPEVARVSNTGR
ncbi:MAG TPA: alpha/beta hydrolase [Blastocatellia bacterium]|nr:alpha/beta hydrolase [Blastocatellia bacterium]